LRQTAKPQSTAAVSIALNWKAFLASYARANNLASVSTDLQPARRPNLGSSSAPNASTPSLVANALKPYSIGGKLRTLRLRKKLGLVELGRHTGFSAALLSKLERDKLYPTLPTLVRIATVFNVGLDYFFTERPGTPDVSYYFEALDYPANSRKLNSYYAEFQNVPKEKVKPHSHTGVELLYLMSGTLVVILSGESYELDAGDSMYFDSCVPHSYRKSGDIHCTALIVTAF